MKLFAIIVAAILTSAAIIWAVVDTQKNREAERAAYDKRLAKAHQLVDEITGSANMGAINQDRLNSYLALPDGYELWLQGSSLKDGERISDMFSYISAWEIAIEAILKTEPSAKPWADKMIARLGELEQSVRAKR